ncbi:ATP-binding protein [Caulobacter sp. 17J80-11]|uniref:ATP-binding protein n=1 Tax=Caulobacter sp. 17J80-11 TaxID=2763502 RepID=UPI0016534B46|nr:ATP-binding protein [Caulobacter sp. 17J80-11]MBC6982567.1 response regulator [Caulobacter sp. 17J80-11]
MERLERIVAVQSLLCSQRVDLDEFMEVIVDRVVEITSAEGVIIELVEGGDMVYRAVDQARAQHLGLRLARAGTLSGLCVERGETLYCRDAEDDERVNREACRRVGLRSMVCVPLVEAGRPVGVLKALSPKVDAFGEDDVELLTMLAQALGAALAREVNLEARRAAEENYKAAAAAAERAAAVKSEFLANMSHEIRTPLTSIIGFAGLLADSGRLGPEEAAWVSRIHVASDALLSVINDVLDYSKLEAGATELDPAPFRLNDLVRDAAGLVDQQAQARGLALNVAVEPEDLMLVGDAGRLRQVLLNFLSNAVKFTSQGGVAVRAYARSATEGRAGLRIEVADTGIGVPPEKLAQLFERFVQADGSISRRFGGTGLGLAISRRLIGMMGGEIGANSRPGQGSTFWVEVELPLAEECAAEAPAAAGPLGAARVLLADDAEANRVLVATLLGAMGLEVDAVANGAEAVAAVQARDYDLVLMDVHMPVMDGLEATRAIRALAPRLETLPILALTADVQPEHVARCRAAGMDDHVGKPIVPAQLYAALSQRLAA